VKTVSYENMPSARAPSPGSLVVYPDGRPNRYRIAEVVGPVAVDPTTDSMWVGVRFPERPDAVDLVSCTSIVNVVPPG
jgi:hypothetical protein